MAIISGGYDGTTDEIVWAKMSPSVGSSEYGVKGVMDWVVTPHPTLDKAVLVSAGSGWGQGVFDTSNATVTVQCAALSSGTRWDLIAADRNWQPVNGITTFVAVTGSATKAIPAGRATNPGVQDDQPLYLVQWTAGQTQPTAIVDLRCWAGNGGVIAADLLARGYLARPGAEVLIDGAKWHYQPVGNGVWDWARESAPFAQASGVVTVSVLKGGNFGSSQIVFPGGRFTIPPIVTISINNGPGGSQSFIPRTYNASTSGTTAALYAGGWEANSSAPNAFGCTLAWTAVQMTATSAAG